jgi:hypothetical protein
MGYDRVHFARKIGTFRRKRETLLLEAVSSYDMPLSNCETTWRHIPEDTNVLRIPLLVFL